MNKYNDKWTREKFLEYRKLKRKGYTFKQLYNHFGDDIYESGMYKKNALSIPYISNFQNFNTIVNEIKLTPEETIYNYVKHPSAFIPNQSDFILTFYSNNIPYVIALMFFPINNKKTYNIVFTTEEQWREYDYKLRTFMNSDTLSNKHYEILDEIISRETKLNDLFPIMRKLAWSLFDFYDKEIPGELLSIGDTKNEKKIKLYRNIIKDSFNNINESISYVSDIPYYIYEIVY